ncbi:MAG: hypothetical protein RJA59_645 [Pseudomonadota bacterium]
MTKREDEDREFVKRELERQHDDFEAKENDKRLRELAAAKLREKQDAEAALSPEEKAAMESELEALEEEQLDRRAPWIPDLLDGALKLMQRRADKTETPLQTPWPSLNAILGGGLWPGLHILTGTTGSGKTQLALQVALNAARRNTPVLYVGLELGPEEIATRLLALVLGEQGGPAPMWSDLYLGKDAGAMQRAREQAVPVLATLPLRVEIGDAGAWTASDLDRRVSVIRRLTGKAPLIVLDYLQLVGNEEPRQDLREGIRAAAIKARNVARRGATVLLLSSVSRENAKLLRPATGKDAEKAEVLGQGDASRLVGLGKESGEIEFSADTVIALGTEAFSPGQTPCHLAAAKVRAGMPGWVSLVFDGTSFSEVTTQTTGGRR